jgi:hypothetical protein
MSRLARFSLVSLLAVILLAACAPEAEAPRLQITPFPTPTAGAVLRGVLLTPVSSVPEGLISPATAVAIAAQPSPTPDLFTCPPLSTAASLEDTPPLNAPIVIEEVLRFLNSGGAYADLDATLRTRWELVREGDSLRGDIDFTGEGSSEILMTYARPDGLSSVLIVGCVEGQWRALYELDTETTEPPQVIAVGDMNRDRRNDLLFSVTQCPVDESGALLEDECELRTRLLAWQPADQRFANLLVDEVLSQNLPQINDFDNDEVSEIVVRLENPGTTRTGPLRTGTHIYDWNGTEYVLSIIQLEPPRFRIQVLHEGDRAITRRNLVEAAQLFQLALDPDSDLRDWIGGESPILQAYGLYRLLITQVASQSAGQAQTYQAILETYPDPEASPIYIRMARTFMETFQAQASPSAACDAVKALVESSSASDALDLINRYGERSPRYTLTDLCPF